MIELQCIHCINISVKRMNETKMKKTPKIKDGLFFEGSSSYQHYLAQIVLHNKVTNYQLIRRFLQKHSVF